MRLTELPTTPDGLPIDQRTGLPKQFKGADGFPMSGSEVAEMMRAGRTLEAIVRKPQCTREGRPAEAIQMPTVVVRSTVNTTLDFDISPRRRDAWDLKATKRTPPDFDIHPKRRS